MGAARPGGGCLNGGEGKVQGAGRLQHGYGGRGQARKRRLAKCNVKGVANGRGKAVRAYGIPVHIY